MRGHDIFKKLEYFHIKWEDRKETNILDNYPTIGTLFLIDDIEQKIIIDDRQFGVIWNFPPVCMVWKY